MILHQLTGRADISTLDSLRDFISVRSIKHNTYTKTLAISIATVCVINFIANNIITTSNNHYSKSESIPTNHTNEIALNMNEVFPSAGIQKYLYSTADCTVDITPTVEVSAERNYGTKIVDSHIDNVYDLSDFSFDTVGYVTTKLNVREQPTTTSDKLGMMTYNDEVYYQKINDEWVAFNYDGKVGFLALKYLSDTKLEYNDVMPVYGDTRKSYMDYTKITLKSSPQYKLQLQATTDTNGLRTVNGRYTIALGSYYTTNVGQYLDIVLSNGTVIPCVVGECKQDRHTNENHSIGADGGAIEFIVETNMLNDESRRQGDISYSVDNWNSNVSEVRLYDIDLL